MKKLTLYIAAFFLFACKSGEKNISELQKNISEHLVNENFSSKNYEIIVLDSLNYNDLIAIETSWMDLEEEDMVAEEMFDSKEAKVIKFQELKGLRDSLLQVNSEDYELVIEVKSENERHFLLVKDDKVLNHFNSIEEINTFNIHEFEGKDLLLKKVEEYKEAQTQEEEIQMEELIEKDL